jgi:hypothetical protein
LEIAKGIGPTNIQQHGGGAAMKMLSIATYDVAKAGDVAKATDKVYSATPGYKPLAMYICLGNPFPGEIPPNSLVTLTISEVQSENDLAAISYPLSLAGVSFHRVPVFEMKPGKSAETEKKFKG